MITKMGRFRFRKWHQEKGYGPEIGTQNSEKGNFPGEYLFFEN
jgi:hypothetical protein